jgi:competence protein ComFC
MGISYIELLGTRSRSKQSRLGKKERFKADNPFYLKENISSISKIFLFVISIFSLR